jgi:hypothetical protein
MLGEELEVSKSEPISRCTTRSTKGFEIEFRALLTDGAQQEVCFERVAVGSTYYTRTSEKPPCRHPGESGRAGVLYRGSGLSPLLPTLKK